jgi:hypothetical protein
MNGDNINNVRHEASRTFQEQKWEYQQDKSNVLGTDSKNKNIGEKNRGINEFKKDF